MAAITSLGAERNARDSEMRGLYFKAPAWKPPTVTYESPCIGKKPHDWGPEPIKKPKKPRKKEKPTGTISGHFVQEIARKEVCRRCGMARITTESGLVIRS